MAVFYYSNNFRFDGLDKYTRIIRQIKSLRLMTGQKVIIQRMAPSYAFEHYSLTIYDYDNQIIIDGTFNGIPSDKDITEAIKELKGYIPGILARNNRMKELGQISVREV